MRVGSQLAIAGMTALAIAMTLSLVLVAHFLYGLWAAVIAGAFAIVAYGVVWYALPIRRRLASPAPDDAI